jgi:hypothetical protein
MNRPPAKAAPRPLAAARTTRIGRLTFHRALLAVAACLTSAAGPPPAPPPHCDPSVLVQEPKTELSYRLVEPDRDRCEGLYARNDSGGCEISIASLTVGGPPTGARLPDRLKLSWSPPTNNFEVRLRARSQRRGLHYQMDSLRPPGARAFDWSTGIAAALDLRGYDLGFLAHGPLAVAEKKEDLLLPVQCETGGGAVQLDIVPSVAIKQLYLTLYSMSPDGTVRAKLQDAQPQLRSFGLAAWGRKNIRLPADLKGLYRLDVNADTSSGGLCAGATAWLYISK